MRHSTNGQFSPQVGTWQASALLVWWSRLLEVGEEDVILKPTGTRSCLTIWLYNTRIYYIDKPLLFMNDVFRLFSGCLSLAGGLPANRPWRSPWASCSKAPGMRSGAPGDGWWCPLAISWRFFARFTFGFMEEIGGYNYHKPWGWCNFITIVYLWGSKKPTFITWGGSLCVVFTCGFTVG